MEDRLDAWRAAVAGLSPPAPPPRPAGPWPSVEELLERARRERAKPEWVAFDDAAHTLMAEMADHYVRAPDGERDEIRRIVASNIALGHITPELVARETERLAAGDGTALDRALAMASMTDGRGSYRDVIVALDRLYRTARAKGVHPAPAFTDMAARSSPVHATGETSLQELLREFPDRFRTSATTRRFGIWGAGRQRPEM